jgi:hypothetical protein
VRVTSLKIDRAGVWADLELTGLSDSLNAIYAGQREDLAAVAELLPAVLYGMDNGPHEYPFRGGELTIEEPRGRYTIRRFVDPQGQHLSLEASDGRTVDKHDFQDLLRGLGRADFERVFTLRLPGQRDVAALLESAQARGFDLQSGVVERERIEALQSEIRETRRQLVETPCGDTALDDLRQREQVLQQQLASPRMGLYDDGLSSQRLEQLASEIADLEELLDQRRGDLAERDAQLDRCRREKRQHSEQIRQMRSQSEGRVAGHRQRLQDIDAQLERWRKVLQDIESRRFSLQDRRDDTLAKAPMERPVDPEPRHYLQRLEQRIEALLKNVMELDESRDLEACGCRRLRSLLGPELQGLRDEIYRLCNELSRWEQRSRCSEQDSELGQLERCQSELRQAMASLTLQRQQTLAEIAEILDVDGVVLTDSHAALCRCLEHPHGVESAVPLEDVPLADEEALQLLEQEIASLEQQRRELQEEITRINDALQRLRERYQQRQEEVDARYGSERHLRERELEQVQRQIESVERRLELSATIARLQAELNRLEASREGFSILGEASAWLQRLSLGDLVTISLESGTRACVRNRRDEVRTYEQLGTTARDQVFLSFCLALAVAYAREGVRLPLLVQDGLSHLDRRTRLATAQVLADFAHQGHQVLFLTRNRELMELFQSLGAVGHHLKTRPYRTPVPEPGLTDQHLQKLNRQLSEIAEETNRPAAEQPTWSSEEFPGELTDRVRPALVKEVSEATPDVEHDRESDYFLLESSPIQEAPSIDQATAERFRKIDVMIVRDLLRIDVDQAASRLRYAGINANMIRRWRAEALLATRVPHLRPYDARILVACGVHSPAQLAQMRAEELRQRVERFSATSVGQVLLRSGNPYELTRLTEWIRSARTRFPDAETPASAGRPVPGRLRKSPHDSDSGWARETVRTQDRRHPNGDPVLLRMNSDDGPPRFYLEINDSIERAPSIGPRTAERFEAIGIRTIADFLRADANTLATRLKRRRIKSRTLRLWQTQTTLAVRTPWLRGHDAQILVACGISDPERLARMDPVELWRIVEPFCQTPECRRIIRNGKPPTFAEVTRWIQWAQQARQLRAA